MTTFNINIYHHPDPEAARGIKQVKTLIKKLMGKIDELNEKVTQLQEAIDAEQQEVANALAVLEAERLRLEDIIKNGATPEQLQSVSDNIQKAIDDVRTTIPNLPDPEEPTEPTEPTEPVEPEA
jgi:seryl-tRNA synthetase